MSCPLTPELLNAYVDDLLSPSERDQVEQHLAECDKCAPLVAALHDEADAVRSALAAGDPTANMHVGPQRRPSAWGVAAAAALVLATSMTTVWLDRMTKPPGSQTLSIGKATFKLGPNANAPRVVVRVTQSDSRWRVEPASYVVNRDGLQSNPQDEVEL